MKKHPTSQTPTFYGRTTEEWLLLERVDPEGAREQWILAQSERAAESIALGFDPVPVYLAALCGALERKYGADSVIAQEARNFEHFATKEGAMGSGGLEGLMQGSLGTLALSPETQPTATLAQPAHLW
jgi:hypothetical protein